MSTLNSSKNSILVESDKSPIGLAHGLAKMHVSAKSIWGARWPSVYNAILTELQANMQHGRQHSGKSLLAAAIAEAKTARNQAYVVAYLATAYQHATEGAK
jgi:hypothetical protein